MRRCGLWPPRLQIDVDLLERELYAMNKSTDDFVAIPRWVTVLDDTRWFGGSGLGRRDVHLIEAFALGCAIILFAASFLVAPHVTKVFRACAVVELLAA